MEQKLGYSLITGKDDSNFCKRISGLIKDGYRLYGSPAVTFNGQEVIAAQAVVRDDTSMNNAGESNDK